MSQEQPNTDLPRISIVIAVYNGASTIQRALDSVFEQTYRGVEIVVIDGGSTDGTQAILERNASRIAYWESEPDRGVYHAWNKALDHVTGQWVCFLGADDRYRGPAVMADVAAALGADAGQHRVAYGSINKVFPDGTVEHRQSSPWTKGRRKGFLRGRMIPHPATFHHRSLFELHGRFDESFRIAGDYELLLRELVRHEPLFLPVLVADWYAGGVSDVPANRYLVEREVYRARHLRGIAKAPPWRAPRLYQALARTWIDRHIRRSIP